MNSSKKKIVINTMKSDMSIVDTLVML
jgi:hypothetical protein